MGVRERGYRQGLNFRVLRTKNIQWDSKHFDTDSEYSQPNRLTVLKQVLIIMLCNIYICIKLIYIYKQLMKFNVNSLLHY